MESNKATIGERIKQQRQKLGLTQQELSQKLYVKRETINQWENGTRQIKGDDIARLADTLETTCDYILRGIETDQLDFFKDLGLTGNAVCILKEMTEIDGCSEMLDSLIGNTYFSILVLRWGQYCEASNKANDAKTEFSTIAEDTGIKNSYMQLSDVECTVEAFRQLDTPTTKECKDAADQLLRCLDRKEYCAFKLQQVIAILRDSYDREVRSHAQT